MIEKAMPQVFGITQRPDHDWLALAESEEPLDPALPIVDAHMHLWHHRSGYRYFVEEAAADVATSGHAVEASVYVECGSMYRATGPDHLKPVGETEFAVGMAAIAASHKYTSARLAAAIIGTTDLRSDKLCAEALQAHIAVGNGRFRGIRQRAKWDADPKVRGAISADGPGLYLDAEFNRGMKRLRALDLVFEASIYHPQLPDLIALARCHPDVPIILNHSGSPVGHSSYAGQDIHSAWIADMRELARSENVSVKLGGVLMNLGDYDFTREAKPWPSGKLAALWRPYIEPCVELFGARRCMVASNFPVDKAGASYGTMWNMFKRALAGCSFDEKRLIFADSARRTYDIPPQ